MKYFEKFKNPCVWRAAEDFQKVSKYSECVADFGFKKNIKNLKIFNNSRRRRADTKNFWNALAFQIFCGRTSPKGCY